MAPACSPVTRARIVDLLSRGESTRAVARQVGRNHSTVSRIYKLYGPENPVLDFYHTKPRSGRPRKLTPTDLKFATSLFARGKVSDATQLQKDYFPGVSVATIRRGLKEAGIKWGHGRRTMRISRRSPKRKPKS